jgi:hypothetical protein
MALPDWHFGCHLQTMKNRGWMFVLLLAAALPAFSQDNEGGWRKFGSTGGSADSAEPAARPEPSLTLPAGYWITVRVNEPLSSDRSQPGDRFTATLAQPLVANGRILAYRGQTVFGVVVEARKAGAVKGTSSLGLEVTEISLADGRQVQVKTRVIDRRGETSVGRDAQAIATTTAVGAAVGAAADGGFGAGMGAIAGAAASTVGVLVTRGRPTIVYPETPLAFRLDNPITVDPGYAQDAFQPVRPEDYEMAGAYQQGLSPASYRRYPVQIYPSVVIVSGRRDYR